MPMLRDYHELVRCLAALPPPEPGRVRVYRGQTKDDGTLLASGHRGRIREAAIWSHYSRAMLIDIERRRWPDVLDEAEEQVWCTWLQAVAQHYGAGSDFLDVTTSIPVAVWFCLHAAREECVRGCSDEANYRADTRWVRFVPWHEPAFLYALDVPRWDGSGLPDPGELVDLADSPAAFSSSPRIKVQSACLVFAGDNPQACDLRSYCVPGTPLCISRPMDGTPGLDRTTDALFPPPSADEWYERFLSLPLVYRPAPSEGTVALRQPLPVSLFRCDQPGPYENDILQRLFCLDPPLAHQALSTDDKNATSSTRLLDAAPIVLECPQLSRHALACDDWNHELLANDMADEILALDYSTKQACDSVSLRNVLIEFSPLEVVGWERARKPGISLDVLRAFWIQRRQSDFAVQSLYQTLPQRALTWRKPVLIRLDASTRRFHYRVSNRESEWTALSLDCEFRKPFLLSLSLLRDLSPVIKPGAFPKIHMSRKTDNQRIFYTEVSAATARLLKVRGPEPDREWYVLRDLAGEPYTESTATHGMVEIRAQCCYSQISAEEIRKVAIGVLGCEE